MAARPASDWLMASWLCKTQVKLLIFTIRITRTPPAESMRKKRTVSK